MTAPHPGASARHGCASAVGEEQVRPDDSQGAQWAETDRSPMSEATRTMIDADDEYWVVARQPLHCLLFLLPLLAAYEAGIVCLGAAGDDHRNGADYWMRAGLGL